MSGPGAGHEFPPQEVSWQKRDVLLFANSIGCKADELHLLYVRRDTLIFRFFATYAKLNPRLGAPPKIRCLPHLPLDSSYVFWFLTFFYRSTGWLTLVTPYSFQTYRPGGHGLLCAFEELSDPWCSAVRQPSRGGRPAQADRLEAFASHQRREEVRAAQPGHWGL